GTRPSPRQRPYRRDTGRTGGPPRGGRARGRETRRAAARSRGLPRSSRDARRRGEAPTSAERLGARARSAHRTIEAYGRMSERRTFLVPLGATPPTISIVATTVPDAFRTVRKGNWDTSVVLTMNITLSKSRGTLAVVSLLTKNGKV